MSTPEQQPAQPITGVPDENAAPQELTAEQKQKERNNCLIAAAGWFLGGVGLGVLVYYQLLPLEEGTKATVRINWMFAMAYNTLGFWPAVCLSPVVGTLLAANSIHDYSKIK